MTRDEALKVFEYRDGRLYWREPTNPKRTPVGSVAGTIGKLGYIHIQYQRRIYKAHRLVYLMFNGHMPKMLDHIDGDRLNNRIENLRLATPLQNAQNARKRTDNTSGVKNVSYHKRIKKWSVSLSVNRKIRHFGYFDDLELAELVALSAREKYHGAFARHV